MSIEKICVTIILIAACAAITWVAVTSMGIAIPPWVVTILWIVAIAVVAILAIKAVLHFWRSTP